MQIPCTAILLQLYRRQIPCIAIPLQLYPSRNPAVQNPAHLNAAVFPPDQDRTGKYCMETM